MYLTDLQMDTGRLPNGYDAGSKWQSASREGGTLRSSPAGPRPSEADGQLISAIGKSLPDSSLWRNPEVCMTEGRGDTVFWVLEQSAGWQWLPRVLKCNKSRAMSAGPLGAPEGAPLPTVEANLPQT